MDPLKTFKVQLAALEYPNISNLNEDQIAQIFATENRIFLLSWAYKKLYNQPIPETQQKRIDLFLADFIHLNGFCASSQKMGFVKGNLNVAEQLQILDRLFAFILLPSTTNMLGNKSTQCLLGDIEKLTSLDLNLFPDFGPIKTRKPLERKQKAQQYLKEIDECRRKIAALKTNEQQECLDAKWGQESDNVENFKVHIENLQSNVAGVVKGAKEEKDYIFSNDFLQVLEKDAPKVKSVLQHLQCGDALNEFLSEAKPEILTKNVKEQKDNSLKHLYDLSQETVNINKEYKII